MHAWFMPTCLGFWALGDLTNSLGCLRRCMQGPAATGCSLAHAPAEVQTCALLHGHAAICHLRCRNRPLEQPAVY